MGHPVKWLKSWEKLNFGVGGFGCLWICHPPDKNCGGTLEAGDSSAADSVLPWTAMLTPVMTPLYSYLPYILQFAQKDAVSDQNFPNTRSWIHPCASCNFKISGYLSAKICFEKGKILVFIKLKYLLHLSEAWTVLVMGVFEVIIPKMTFKFGANRNNFNCIRVRWC